MIPLWNNSSKDTSTTNDDSWTKTLKGFVFLIRFNLTHNLIFNNNQSIDKYGSTIQLVSRALGGAKKRKKNYSTPKKVKLPELNEVDDNGKITRQRRERPNEKGYTLFTLLQEGVKNRIYHPLEVSVKTLEGNIHKARTYQLTTGNKSVQRPSLVYLNVIIQGAVEHNLPKVEEVEEMNENQQKPDRIFIFGKSEYRAKKKMLNIPCVLGGKNIKIKT
ncbi:hypothetical protein Avbf_04423 [Armadillidium vulgare]|nr:hypothetical protein Avbf_04423 [Armadillidium vulgare]